METKEPQKYSITIEKERATSNAVMVPDKLKKLVGENGIIPLKPNVEVINHILAESMYQDPNDGLRELYNNELRQCRLAIKEGHNAEINIHIDPKTRKMIIEGINSMGLSIDVFDEIFRSPGESSNFDGDESGQFGIGLMSYQSLSEIAVFDIYSRETGEKYSVSGKQNKGFEPINTTPLKTPGVKITLILKPKIKIYDFIEYAKKLCKFTNIKTTLILSSIVKKSDGNYGEIIKAGSYLLGPIPAKQILKGDKDDDDTVWIEIDNDDYYLLGAYAGYSYEPKIFTYLIGIPIKLENIPNPGFSKYVLNIKNERKYSPVGSRDVLNKESLELLSQKITNDLKAIFEKVYVKTVKDYVSSENKFIVNNLPCNEFLDFIPDETKRFHEFLSKSIRYFHRKEGVTEENSWATIKSIVNYENIYCMYNANKRRIETVLEIDPNAVVIIPKFDKYHRWDALRYFEDAGITTATEFIKLNKAKVPQAILEEVIVHSSRDSEHISPSELTQKDVRIPRGTSVKPFKDILSSGNYPDIRILKDNIKLETGILLDDFISKVNETQFSTSSGPKSGKYLLTNHTKSIFVSSWNRFENQLQISDIKKLWPQTNLVINDNAENETILKFTAAIQNKQFHEIVNQRDLAKLITSSLKIEFEGAWIDYFEKTVIPIKKIKSKILKEYFVRSFDELGNGRYYTFDWDDENNQKSHDHLCKIFLKMDNDIISPDKLNIYEYVRDNIPKGENYASGITKISYELHELVNDSMKNELKNMRTSKKLEILKKIYFTIPGIDVILESTNSKKYILKLSSIKKIHFDYSIIKKIDNDFDIEMELESVSTTINRGKSKMEIILCQSQ